MRVLLIVLGLFLGLQNCDLFNKDSGPDLGVCSEELFNSVKEKEAIPIIATYAMEWTSEEMLTDEEIEAQRAAIQNMHERFIHELESNGFVVDGEPKFTYTPHISLYVNFEKLEFVCNSESIVEVVESGIRYIN